MRNVIPLRKFAAKDGLTAAQRATAWTNYYQDEVAQGVPEDTAQNRADAHLDHRFAGQMASIRCILDEVQT
jgi:ribosomal protein RSM22 (predicted rRNA methylase)